MYQVILDLNKSSRTNIRAHSLANLKALFFMSETWESSSFFFFLKKKNPHKDMYYCFSIERTGEKNQCDGETSFLSLLWGCLPILSTTWTRNLGMCRLGIKTATFWCTGWCSTNLATQPELKFLSWSKFTEPPWPCQVFQLVGASSLYQKVLG